MKSERKLSKLKVFSLCHQLYHAYNDFTTGSHISISYFVKTETLIFFSVLIQTFKQLTIYNRSLCTNWWHCIQGGTADNIIRTKSETKLGCCRVPFRNLKPRHCSLCRWQFKVFKVFHSRAQHTESERTAVKALRSAAEWWKEKYYDVIVSVNVCINNV